MKIAFWPQAVPAPPIPLTAARAISKGTRRMAGWPVVIATVPAAAPTITVPTAEYVAIGSYVVGHALMVPLTRSSSRSNIRRHPARHSSSSRSRCMNSRKGASSCRQRCIGRMLACKYR